MLRADTALEIILKEAKPLASEKVKLRNALGRTLAADIVAHENIPPFDNSSMDGFALRADDVRAATKKNRITLKIIGESAAGNLFKGKVEAATAVRVMTGGKIPNGADCVVPIELVEVVDKQTIRLSSSVKVGAYIRRAGEDIRTKEVALVKGEVLSPARIGILASLGYSKVRVASKPIVNILATGDELIELGDELREGQIRNSNSYSLASYVEQSGGEPNILGVVPDKKKRLRKAIRAALDCDVLLISGGVSVGKYDFVKEILSDVGVEAKFWQVNIKPGKPLVFGKHKKTLVFGLPGNPASTAVTFLQFVRPAIFKLLGRGFSAQLQLSAILDEPISKSDGKRHFVRGFASTKSGALHVRTTGTQSSGALSSMAKANCFIIIPETTKLLKKGSRVMIELLKLET